MRGYRATTFRATVDHPDSARALSAAAQGLDRPVPVLVDLEIGMGRTGIDPGAAAAELYALVDRLPNLAADGLHAYDGHIHDSDLAARRHAAQSGLASTLALYDRLLKRGLPVPRLVVGGTPTFPIHAELDLPGVECSPGTTVLQDDSYLTRYPDLPFTPAALLLTRVVSHPGPGRLCLDLGYKAVAADPVGPRARLLELDDARPVVHSEEHLVVETARADSIPIGTPLLAIPTHICPTRRLAPPRLRHRGRPGRRPMGSHRPRSRAGDLAPIPGSATRWLISAHGFDAALFRPAVVGRHSISKLL